MKNTLDAYLGKFTSHKCVRMRWMVAGQVTTIDCTHNYIRTYVHTNF